VGWGYGDLEEFGMACADAVIDSPAALLPCVRAL
jgi:hypothetical protein